MVKHGTRNVGSIEVGVEVIYAQPGRDRKKARMRREKVTTSSS